MDEITETLSYYKDALNSSTLEVLPIAYLLTDDTDVPLTGNVTEAEFRITIVNDNGTQTRKVRKTLSNAGGLAYDVATGALTGSIYNADVTFITDTGSYAYHCFIVMDGITYDVAQGPLDSTRVD